MKMFNSFYTHLVLVIALVLAFSVPVKAQNKPEDYLNAHNRARATVGVSPLIWKETLADYAQAYAMKRTDCSLIFSGGPYGEAIILSSSLDLSADQAVSLMVAQRSDYDYATNTCRAGKLCSAYKQVVWRNSKSLGCGKVRCDNGGSLICCSYDPSGNVGGERPF